MVDMTNCPNCGAVITGPQCEYCGTRFRLYSENELVAVKTKANLEHEALRLENELLAAKTKVLTKAEVFKVLYKEAIKARHRHRY